MSLTTLLLAFLPAFVQPKRESRGTRAWRDAAAEWRRAAQELKNRVTELEGEVDRLLRLNERVAGRIRELEVEPRIAQQAALRAQYEHGALVPVEGWYGGGQTPQLAAQQAMPMIYGQGQMLGAQNLALAQYQAQAWRECTCVPARHDMLLGAIGGA